MELEDIAIVRARIQLLVVRYCNEIDAIAIRYAQKEESDEEAS